MPKNRDKDKLTEKEKELVVARLEVLSPNVYFASGSGSNISRNEMIKHVMNNDKTGKEFMETEMEFLRAIKDGKLLKQMLSFQTSQ